ncbi:MAG: hypothetical protein IPM69_18500 [Ignavibacteria bacterium]|nr:hypothetical protein [Ignavibacteria bacterium]
MKTLILSTVFALLLAIGNQNFAISAEIWERTGTFDGELSGGVISMGLANNGHVFACANTGAPTYRSIDNGTTWVKSSLPSNNYLNAFATSDSIMLGASQKGMYRSTNHGATWKLSNTGLTSLNVRSVQFSSNGVVFAGTHGGGVFRSIDSGITWQAVNSGLSILKISAIALLDSVTLLAATDGEGMFFSSDGGSSWSVISAEVRLNSVRSFAVNSSGVVFAGTDQFGIFRSTTRGVSWDYLPTDITSSVNAIICKANEIYVATGLNGVFYSNDNGDSWREENTGISGNVGYCFTMNALGQVLVGSNGSAVYRRTTINTVDELSSRSHLTLDRISYTNQILTVLYSTDNSTLATFTFHSLLGEIMHSSTTEMIESGTHQYRFDIGSLPRGTYLCRVVTRKNTSSQLFQIP